VVERFDATIQEAERGGAFVPVPAKVVEALGGKGRIPVRATFDGIAYQGLAARFEALSFTHRREYVQWITEAKRPDTRARRISQTIERLQGSPR
jgi:hypothetical protein